MRWRLRWDCLIGVVVVCMFVCANPNHNPWQFHLVPLESPAKSSIWFPCSGRWSTSKLNAKRQELVDELRTMKPDMRREEDILDILESLGEEIEEENRPLA